jgi:N-acetylmuramoyl-L-alanine amidase
MPMFKLAISAGHYLGNPKRCHKSLDPNETREWWLNDRIADKLEKILAEYNGIEVLRLDDTTGKKSVSNEERARIANNWKADLYLAIHHNAADKVFSGGGITAYIHSTNVKPGAAEWQKAFYDTCIKYTSLKGNRATPLAKKALYECGAPNCPSVLMELGFMDSTVDVPIILTDAYATKIAEAIAEVVIAKSGATKKKRTLYRVQVGAFSKEVYAEEMLKKLKAAGFEGYITIL